MPDKIEVTGIEIKINGEKVLLSLEEWGLRRELDDGLLHVEGVPYPYSWPVTLFTPYVPPATSSGSGDMRVTRYTL